MTCKSCLGDHPNDTPDIFVEWRGIVYHAPFLCMCCGKEICARQFAYGRGCGVCDAGLCQTKPDIYGHPDTRTELVHGALNPEDYLKGR